MANFLRFKQPGKDRDVIINLEHVASISEFETEQDEERDWYAANSHGMTVYVLWSRTGNQRLVCYLGDMQSLVALLNGY